MFERINKTRILNNVFPALVFYVVAALVVYVLETWAPSDMCNPGLGMILLLFMPIVSTVLFMKALIKDVSNDQIIFRTSTIIHAIFTWVLWQWIYG